MFFEWWVLPVRSVFAIGEDVADQIEVLVFFVLRILARLW